MGTKCYPFSIALIHRILILLTIVLVSSACDVITPDSHTLIMKTTDIAGVPAVANSALTDVVVHPQDLSGNTLPEDMTFETLSDAEGIVVLNLGATPHSISFELTAKMNTLAWVRVGESTVDLSLYPVIMVDANGTGNYCLDSLNVANSGETHSSAWLCVYKTSGAFTSADTMSIRTIVNGFTVAGGSDLVDEVTADGSLNYIDIFDDTLVSADTPGHKDDEILANNVNGAIETLYNVKLNRISQQLNILPCSRNSFSIAYF